MAVSYNGASVSVSSYKSGTTTANSTTNLQITSGQIAAGDLGRLVAVIPDPTATAETQVRLITGVSGGTISIHDPWVGTIPSGTTWRVAHTLEDVHAIGNAGLQKVGGWTYRWAGDWDVQSTGFLGDVDRSLEMVTNRSPAWLIAPGGIVQFGIAYGGEGSAEQTARGCRLVFNSTVSNQVLYRSADINDPEGPVLNYYNCLVHSSGSGGGWQFQRMSGPTRWIGCNFDGPMGGRFSNPASEWVQCRMTGNDNLTPPFGLAATFTRAIDTVKFYRNLGDLKSFEAFSGVFRNTTFEDSTYVVVRQASAAGSVFDFIDCTEFGSGSLSGTGGTLNQYRSINIVTTDSGGTPLDGITFRVNNNADVTQGSVVVSSDGGILPETIARRFLHTHGSATRQSFAPFRMRYRAYGYLWQSINADIADPIKQGVAMLSDANVTQSSAVALAHTGITIADTAPVTWEGKAFSITVTGNLTTNPSLTAEDIKHYLHYHLAQTAGIGGKASGLNWHDLIPMAGFATTRDNYSGTQKGVRIVDQAGNPFTDILTMTADDGTTLSYAPVVLATASITGFTANSRIIIYNVTTATEMYNDRPAATSYVATYENGTGYTGGDVIDVFHVYYQADGEYATRKTRTRTVAGSGGWSVLIDEVECTSYSTYFDTFGTTGEAVYTTGEFAFDGSQIDVNIDVPGAAVAWFAHKLFQWDKYTLWLTGNREFFQKISAGSTTQINIGDMLLDNIASPARNYVQDDVIQVVRTDGSYPVRNPSTGGGGIDVVWKQPVLAVTTGGLSPSEGQIKTWVRSELTVTEARQVTMNEGIKKASNLIPHSTDL